ncbi:MAG: hypothetical protein D6815_04210, partial [Candidatus Dadabacteria bacterium]
AKVAALEAQAEQRKAPSGRVLEDWQREAMIARLRQESGPTKDVWFVRVANDPEAAAFERSLRSAFEEAGWRVRASKVAGFPLRAGVFFLAADETPPSYVDTALGALTDAGIEVSSGRGYRAFYEQRKRENPNWRGIDFAPDQDYVIAIGPAPKPEADEQ